MAEKLVIELNEYMYSCGDGCCANYGTQVKVNGIEMEAHNTDTATILTQILNHLGYDDVEIIETWDDDEN